MGRLLIYDANVINKHSFAEFCTYKNLVNYCIFFKYPKDLING